MADYITTFNVKDINSNHLHSISFDARDEIGSPSIVNSPFNYTYTSLDTFYPKFEVPGFVGKVQSVIITETGQTVNVILYKILEGDIFGTDGNRYIDQVIYTGNVMTSCRIRVYSNPTSVGTDSDVIATFNVTVTQSNGKMTTFKETKA